MFSICDMLKTTGTVLERLHMLDSNESTSSLIAGFFSSVYHVKMESARLVFAFGAAAVRPFEPSTFFFLDHRFRSIDLFCCLLAVSVTSVATADAETEIYRVCRSFSEKFRELATSYLNNAVAMSQRVSTSFVRFHVFFLFLGLLSVSLLTFSRNKSVVFL
jgi:hypothetical protein